MTFHSDSNLGAILPFLVVVLALVLFLLSEVFSNTKRVRSFLKMGAIALLPAYLVCVILVSLTAPPTVVKVGESYCADNWCIGIDRVHATAHGNDIEYKLDVHIFSDANRVNTSAKGVSFYLFDEKGRHFPLVSDPSAVPVDITLSPRQSVNTSLTFVAASDARQLYLWGDERTKPPFWYNLYLGSDFSWFHKPPLLKVL